MKINFNLFNFSQNKNVIRQIVKEIKILFRQSYHHRFWIEYYGSYLFDTSPKHLVVLICVDSDEIKTELKLNIQFMDSIIEIFRIHNYPEEAWPFLIIDFESQETVNRESNGDWYLHLK